MNSKVINESGKQKFDLKTIRWKESLPIILLHSIYT